MYDPETAALLRSAPGFPGLDPANIPQLLTKHYAQIVSIRLSGEEQPVVEDEWPLHRIADAYEVVVSVSSDPVLRRASAFVAASAQLLLGRKHELSKKGVFGGPNVSRDHLAPDLAAALLFLCAEQYADANEAASKVNFAQSEQQPFVSIVTRHIVDLSKGQLLGIVERGNSPPELIYEGGDPLEVIAFNAMLRTLASGIEALARSMLGLETESIGFDSPRAAFEKVKLLAAARDNDPLTFCIEYTYPGIFHLASLLVCVCDSVYEMSLIDVEPPNGPDSEFWKKWIAFRAIKFPYLWPNHRKALEKGFHRHGTSAVIVLPTGAGKTTVSSIKIAGVLAEGKKVIFLAPTHALVEQLTVDLQEMFPEDILGSSVSSDFDLLFQVGTVLPEIEVMTPERCLAMLSFSPDSFSDVGLLVFDECHLLSPQSGRIRRSLDSMLCLLAFTKIAPNADMLFLSAMVKNGDELSDWISQLTGRDCISVDLLWKPSRQARGIVIYSEDEIEGMKKRVLSEQRTLDVNAGNTARSLRAGASKLLTVHPHVIWGLQHNWLDMENKSAACTITKLMLDEVSLSGVPKDNQLRVKPNVNKVAAKIAEKCALIGVKTIVFVNQKSHAISTAKYISDELGASISSVDSEELRWDALEEELGDLKHSLLTKGSKAVPHNASMLRIERELSERMYKRADGAMVIVATPTLAQGLNLPAQMAILAGDKRADVETGGRELLEAHELLNAAARAGRAGHLANGIVLLIPEPLLMYPENEDLDINVFRKLQSLMPEDDRCVEISDPISKILDEISDGEEIGRDVLYMVNRLATLNDVDNESNDLFNLKYSFAAYRSRTRGEEDLFHTQLASLESLVKLESIDEFNQAILILASQSGLPPVVLSRLKQKIMQDIGILPVTIEGWILWVINWLCADSDSLDLLLFDVNGSILGATGRKKTDDVTGEVLRDLMPGIKSWISGSPVSEIESALGGDPNSPKATSKSCPRARELIGSVLPRGLSFVMGLITRVVTDINPYDQQEDLSPEIVDVLSTAVRRGYDSPEKITYAFSNPAILSRVVVHRSYNVDSDSL